MAKAKSVAVNTQLLAAIKGGHVTHVTQAEAVEAGLQHNPPLVEVNTSPAAIVDGKAPIRLTDAGHAHVGNGAAAPAASNGSGFALITGAELPASKRRGGGGGSGAPQKYPFDEMEVGQSFFVAADEKHPDPVKSLGSTISSANMRYAEETGETKVVERTKRGPGNKAVVGPDGKNVRETKTVDVYKPTRKFNIRPVEAGVSYGQWVAPANGALIARMM